MRSGELTVRLFFFQIVYRLVISKLGVIMSQKRSDPDNSTDHCVIVFSHTEIRKDNRILKVVEALLSLDGVHVVAIGRQRRGSSTPVSGPATKRFSTHDIHDDEFLESLRRWVRRSSLSESLNPLRSFFRRPLKFLGLVAFNCVIAAESLRRANWKRTSLVYCNDAYCLPASVAVSALTGSKLVYDAHELEHDKNGQSRVSQAITLSLEKTCWPFVDYFITVSESIRDHYLRTIGPKPSSVVLNSPLLIPSSEKAEVSDIRKDLGLGPDQIILIYVGALFEGRGIRGLLDSAESLPKNHHLVFLGEGALASDITSRGENLTNVHLVSPVSHEAVVDYISTADIGLCLLEPVSLSDILALPNKFFEYAFAGLPVLYSDLPELARLGRAYRLGATCDLSVSAILKGVTDLKGVRTSRKNLEPLSWERQRKHLAEVVSSLLVT